MERVFYSATVELQVVRVFNIGDLASGCDAVALGQSPLYTVN